eukprot:TRINITY_DN10_c0_g1_i1.p1 TRINITY_DN10_c0_g1~~TRINITY_DN10_c0_g1_i1.p1  ORF type:complete len:791 (-),score=61.05 TRINITY_DN10_c0_g1_i1:2120-4492(-)
MDDTSTSWSFNGKKTMFTQVFKDPESEHIYLSVRSNKLISLMPRILMLTLCVFILLRRLQLFLIACGEANEDSYFNEARLLSVTVLTLSLELVTHLSEKLASLRCVMLVLLFFYSTADGSLTYYISRIRNEPVYTFRLVFYYDKISLTENSSFQIAGTLPVFCSLLCYSWISSFIVHVIGQCFIVGYAFSSYDLNAPNKVFMISFIVAITIGYAFYFYCCEHALRYGALQYARKNMVSLLFVKLRQETKNWKEMMDRLPQAILLKQGQEIVYANHSANCMFSIPENLPLQSKAEKVANELRLIVNNEVSLHQFIELPIIGDDTKSMCFQYKDRIGCERRLKATVWKTSFDSRESLACTIEDLTTSLQLERQMMNKKFEKIFLASFTHELITPINGMLGIMDLIHASEGIADLINTAKSTCKLLLYLTNDVVEIAKEHTASIKPQQDWFKVKDVLEECGRLLEFGFKEKHLPFLTDVTPSVPPVIGTDRTKYRQTIVHLLTNGLKYTMEGNVTIQVSFDSAENILKTSVIDTGIGISAEGMETLFKLFGDLDKRCELNPQGVGLGLTICRKYAEILGGKLTVSSERNYESIFTLIIPVRICESNAESFAVSHEDSEIPSIEEIPEEQKPVAPYNFKKNCSKTFHSYTKVLLSMPTYDCGCKEFLIVDDVELNRFVLKGMMQKFGFDCEEAVNGEKAVKMVRARAKRGCCKKYAIIFMDINMPVMDGTEATRILKAEMREAEIEYTPIVAVTAAQCETPADRESYFRAGFDEFSTFVGQQRKQWRNRWCHRR